MRVVKKPEERKAEMVAAASKLFAQQGFVRTSVAEIVSAVDVAKGLFYYYFTTKDDMVKAVVEGYCSYLGNEAQKIADSACSVQEKIARLDSEFKTTYRLIMERPGMMEYNAAKSDLDGLVQFINQIIVGSANGQDPDNIQQSTGCTGSCSSCSGCGN